METGARRGVRAPVARDALTPGGETGVLNLHAGPTESGDHQGPREHAQFVNWMWQCQQFSSIPTGITKTCSGHLLLDLGGARLMLTTNREGSTGSSITILKQKEVPNCEPWRYATARVWATSKDTNSAHADSN